MARLTLVDFVMASEKVVPLKKDDGSDFGDVVIKFVAPEALIAVLKKYGKEDSVSKGELSVDPAENLSYINAVLQEAMVDPVLEKPEDAIKFGAHRFTIFSEVMTFSGLVGKGTPEDKNFRGSGAKPSDASGEQAA